MEIKWLKIKGNQEETEEEDVFEDGIGENEESENEIESLEERIRVHKKRFRVKMIVGMLLFLAVVGGTYALIEFQTYSEMNTLNSYKSSSRENGNYVRYGDGVLEYSRDGASFLSLGGKEQWNQSYQMKNPVVEVCGDTAIVADSGGNDIVVLKKDGVKGEIHTALPIEKAVVSGQGIVGVLLRDEVAPKVLCYDATGNMLVEQKASMKGTGYPIDISISENGYLLMVSYLQVKDGTMFSNVVFYNFDKVGQDETDHQVLKSTQEGDIVPTTFFMNSKTAVAVGGEELYIYKGDQIPELSASAKVEKEIKSVFHSDKYIGLILKNEGKEGSEIRLYNMSGKVVMSEEFAGEYGHVKMEGGQIWMYDGTACKVFNRRGVKKFDGEAAEHILEMFPAPGINKYIVINANGIEEVRFVK